MLELIAIVLVAAGAAIAVRWWLNRVDSIGRKVPLPWSAWMLPLLGFLAAIPVVCHHTEEARLGSVASVLARGHSTVHCRSGTAEWVDAGAELGYVKWGEDGVPEHSTLIKHEQCGLIGRYLSGGRDRPSRDEVIAVHVLTHESMHMAGITSESEAECAAVQRDFQTAELLGANDTQAEYLVRVYWVTVYPDMPEDYRTSECRSGGSLDEGLSNPPWSFT